MSDITAELRIECVESDFAILDGVMKQGGDDRIFIQAHVGQNIGHGNRVGEIGLAGRTVLAVVRAFAEFKGARQTP